MLSAKVGKKRADPMQTGAVYYRQDSSKVTKNSFREPVTFGADFCKTRKWEIKSASFGLLQKIILLSFV
jgi:hypothetical protein